MVYGVADGNEDVSYACPWAHRALIVRSLKGLESILPYTSVHWEMLEKGWRFATPNEDIPGENVTPDPVKGHEGFTVSRTSRGTGQTWRALWRLQWKSRSWQERC